MGGQRHQGGRDRVRPQPGAPFQDGEPAQPFVGAQVFFVAAGGENTAVAQEFVANYLTSPELAVALYQAEPRPPALTAALEHVQADNPDLATFIAAAEHGVRSGCTA